MPKQYLIVFDLDGTLIQSQIDYMGIRDEIRSILKDLISQDEYIEVENTIYTILELVEMIKKNDSTSLLYKKAWSIVEEYEKNGYLKATVADDVHTTINKLKELNHIITIYTNNSRKLTDYALKTYNFNDIFEYVLTRDEMTETKPNPEGLQFLMNKFEKEREETIFVGDSWVDAETALNASVKFIYFGKESAPGTRRKRIESFATIDKINDILTLL